MSIEDGIRNYQYLDRLAALYLERGIELHRRQPGFLTGTNIPPSIAITICILDLLLAAAQGVRNYGLELGQTRTWSRTRTVIFVSWTRPRCPFPPTCWNFIWSVCNCGPKKKENPSTTTWRSTASTRSPSPSPP